MNKVERSCMMSASGVVLGIERSGVTGLLFERLIWRGAFTLSDRIDHVMSYLGTSYMIYVYKVGWALVT